MKKKRLIPVLLLRNGWLVQSKGFSEYQNLGNPITAVKRLSQWASDELIYLDISTDENYDMRREDLHNPNRHTIFEILDDVSKRTFMPITIGGKIRTLKDIEDRLSRGADKISINTKPLEDKKFITQAAKQFGSQCVVVSIDVKKIDDSYIVMKNSGSEITKYGAKEWAKIAEECGAGEILLNSVDRDGKKNGYEIPLLQEVSQAVKIPVIACGGAGEWFDFAEAFDESAVDAVAAANVFHHIDQSVYLAKKYLYDNNYKVRPPNLLGIDETL
ncbi:MAG: imidazole glycerol phosphate synthase subunit HisF [Patescibacteria group bacterium]|nr:MAG: imidazole glycerol phosphate synthase subunit HisF [Patescibacteria group bacterium]